VVLDKDDGRTVFLDQFELQIANRLHDAVKFCAVAMRQGSPRYRGRHDERRKGSQFFHYILHSCNDFDVGVAAITHFFEVNANAGDEYPRPAST